MKQLKNLYDEVFRTNVWILISPDKKDYIEVYKKYFNESPPIEDNDYDKICARYSVGNYKDSEIHLIWCKELEISQLVHEVCHLVYNVLSRKGIELNDFTDEVYAYYSEYFLKAILKLFKVK